MERDFVVFVILLAISLLGVVVITSGSEDENKTENNRVFFDGEHESRIYFDESE